MALEVPRQRLGLLGDAADVGAVSVEVHDGASRAAPVGFAPGVRVHRAEIGAEHDHARDVDADGGRAHASRDVHGHVHDDGLVHDVADLELAHEGLACGGDDEGV